MFIKKIFGKLTITLFFLAILFQGCSTRDLCPAYTDSETEVETTLAKYDED